MIFIVFIASLLLYIVWSTILAVFLILLSALIFGYSLSFTWAYILTLIITVVGYKMSKNVPDEDKETE